MTQEKLKSLNTYLTHLKNRLSDPVPPKHQKHPESFKRWLRNEIKDVKDQLDAAALEGKGDTK
jgi:hypothetical protein